MKTTVNDHYVEAGRLRAIDLLTSKERLASFRLSLFDQSDTAINLDSYHSWYRNLHVLAGCEARADQMPAARADILDFGPSLIPMP
jgi:hypothetical protein